MRDRRIPRSRPSHRSQAECREPQNPLERCCRCSRCARDRARTRAPKPGRAAADRPFHGRRPELAIGKADVAVEAGFRLHRKKIDDTRRGIAAEQGALRSTQHFHPLDVEQREALQDHVLQHHVIDDDGNGLRGGQVEVGVAETADIEARRETSIRGFGVRLGTRVANSRISPAPSNIAASRSPEIADTEIGTSCRFCSWRCAVTTISWSVPADSCANAEPVPATRAVPKTTAARLPIDDPNERRVVVMAEPPANNF